MVGMVGNVHVSRPPQTPSPIPAHGRASAPAPSWSCRCHRDPQWPFGDGNGFLPRWAPKRVLGTMTPPSPFQSSWALRQSPQRGCRSRGGPGGSRIRIAAAPNVTSGLLCRGAGSAPLGSLGCRSGLGRRQWWGTGTTGAPPKLLPQLHALGSMGKGRILPGAAPGPQEDRAKPSLSMSRQGWRWAPWHPRPPGDPTVRTSPRPWGLLLLLGCLDDPGGSSRVLGC